VLETATAGLLALDYLRAAVVLCDAQGRMTWMNAAAKKILDRSDGLSVVQGGLLAATRPDETNRLRHLISVASADALRGKRRPGQDSAHAPAGGPIRLSRSSGAGALELLVAPLRAGAPGGAGRGRARGSVMIFVSDPEEPVNIEVAALRQLYGLTVAEARLTVQLLRGMDMPTAASSMGISINTARTLVRRSFERTDTNRQSDLVSKILRGPLGHIIRAT
jgi:DNA-binding CsgD family transcriptional regulator